MSSIRLVCLSRHVACQDAVAVSCRTNAMGLAKMVLSSDQHPAHQRCRDCQPDQHLPKTGASCLNEEILLRIFDARTLEGSLRFKPHHVSRVRINYPFVSPQQSRFRGAIIYNFQPPFCWDIMPRPQGFHSPVENFPYN